MMCCKECFLDLLALRARKQDSQKEYCIICGEEKID